MAVIGMEETRKSILFHFWPPLYATNVREKFNLEGNNGCPTRFLIVAYPMLQYQLSYISNLISLDVALLLFCYHSQPYSSQFLSFQTALYKYSINHYMNFMSSTILNIEFWFLFCQNLFLYFKINFTKQFFTSPIKWSEL